MEEIKIATTLSDDEPVIERRTFENALILGPAILAFSGPVTFDDNTFEGESWDSLLIELPEGTEVTGVIPLRDVTFKNCVFRDIGIIGTPETLRAFREVVPKPKLVHAVPS